MRLLLVSWLLGGCAAVTSSAGVASSTCFSPGSCDVVLVDFMDSARETLDIAIYSLTKANILDAIKAAQSRHVSVRVVIDKGQTDAIKTLKAAKVPVRIGSDPGLMHNKFTIVDRKRVETGSFNYSNAATTRNSENQIYLDDAAVVADFVDYFDQLWRDAQ